jgi:hypothetical protein
MSHEEAILLSMYLGSEKGSCGGICVYIYVSWEGL